MKKNIIKVIIIISIIIVIYSLFNILIWKKDNDKNEEIKIKTNNIIKDGKEPFKALSDINSDIKGHINVPGTKVNYVFVQTNDNKYYLKHNLNKEYNKSGWIFADYRNKLDGSDKNIIIYGHDVMFSSLKNTLSSKWSSINKYIYLDIGAKKYTYQVFSSYETPNENSYLKTSFNNDFMDFINKLKDKSFVNYNTSVNSYDQILTLSTCSHSGKDRIVVHAKKINS